MRQFSTNRRREITVGVDLGKRKSHVFAVSPQGELLEDQLISSSAETFEKFFGQWEHAEVVIEAGPQAVWVNALLQKLGHTVLVVNPREMPEIYKTKKKTDRIDAKKLARAAWRDRAELPLVHLRSLKQQAEIAVIRSRMLFVKQRTEMINHVRSRCLSFGCCLPACDGHYFERKVKDKIPQELAPALLAILKQIANLSAQIADFDKQIEGLCKSYPPTDRLRTVHGVGALTALAFVLTVHDHRRFEQSRLVGSYIGLTPIVDRSSGRDPQLRISKCGDPYMRKLLVTAAHCILGPHALDSELRRFGQRICPPGSKNRGAKKRAVVAVARKLAALLHHLWNNDKDYQPFPNGTPQKQSLPGHGRRPPGKMKSSSQLAGAN